MEQNTYKRQYEQKKGIAPAMTQTTKDYKPPFPSHDYPLYQKTRAKPTRGKREQERNSRYQNANSV